MHIHSVYSGHAALKTKQIIDFCKKKNIVPALTDHDSTKGWSSFKKEAKLKGIQAILGEEIKVYKEKEYLGELLGLFMQEEIMPGDIDEVLDKLKEQDALISIPHPFDYFRKPLFSSFKRLEEYWKRVDAIEVFNSRCCLNAFNKKAKEFAVKKGMPFTAGSDAHFSIELGNAFLVIKASSLEEARKKILRGKCSYQGRISPKRVQLYTHLAKIGFLSESNE